jgi:hypothetical protein
MKRREMDKKKEEGRKKREEKEGEELGGLYNNI